MDKGLYSSKASKNKGPLLKIVLVGDSEVGKSTIISSFVNEGVPKEKFKKSVGIDSVLKYFEWDTAGDDKLRTMISSYYRGAHSVIIVYDYTNLNSFYSLKNWLREIRQFAPENCIKYLVCNKVDKFSCDSTTNIKEVEKFAKLNNLKFIKVSALTNTGINELFTSVTDDILNSLDSETLNIRSESFKIQLINGEFFHKEKVNNLKSGISKDVSNLDYNINSSRRRSECCFRVI